MAIIFFFPFPVSFPFLVTTSENNSAMSFFFSAAPVRTGLLPAKEPKLLHQQLVKYYGGLVTAEVQQQPCKLLWNFVYALFKKTSRSVLASFETRGAAVSDASLSSDCHRALHSAQGGLSRAARLDCQCRQSSGSAKIGTLRSNDADGNAKVEKSIGFMSKQQL